MDITGLKEQILEIKDKVIDNVNEHFNEYISEDLQDIGEDEYFLVDSVSYSIYWMERLRALKPIMDSLLSEHQSDEELPDFNRLWDECITLKRIIDGNILKYEVAANQEEAVNHYEVFGFIGLDIKPPKKPNPISFTINESSLKELHRGLKHRFGFISITFEEFQKHREPAEKEYNKIHWNSLDLDLVMFVLLMLKYRLIPLKYARLKYQIELIVTHFNNENNLPFKPNSIGTQLRKMKRNLDSILYEELDAFMAQL